MYLLLPILFLSGCHFCIDELNFINSLLPALQGWYEYFHNRLHKDNNKCHKDKIKCCRKEMEIVFGTKDYFWRLMHDGWVRYTYRSYYCVKCKGIKQIGD